MVICANIIIYIIYKCFKRFKENIRRFDFIYSKNYDRIFIGIVKYTKTSYVNTFEFEMNDIERFILQKMGNNSISYDLKVVFKNGESQNICNIRKRSQEELEGLAYILNEKIIIKSKENNNTENNNVTNQ